MSSWLPVTCSCYGGDVTVTASGITHSLCIACGAGFTDSGLGVDEKDVSVSVWLAITLGCWSFVAARYWSTVWRVDGL